MTQVYNIWYQLMNKRSKILFTAYNSKYYLTLFLCVLNLSSKSLFYVYPAVSHSWLSNSLHSGLSQLLDHYLFPNCVICYCVSLQKIAPDDHPTWSAHPARFSPDDKYSRQRITIKKRFGLLLTQTPKPILWWLIRPDIGIR